MDRRSSFPLLIGLAVATLGILSAANLAAQPAPPRPRPKVVGAFSFWTIYDQGYTVKSIVSSGSAPLLTHIGYGFGNVAPNADGSQVVCQLGDTWADYQKPWTAAESVNGVDVPWERPLRGNFQQLKALKARYPNLKVLIALGGADWSGHFSDMAVTPASRRAFVQSCLDLFIQGNLPRDLDAGGPGTAAGVFDGIEIDWEFPGDCQNACESRPEDVQNLTALLQEFRRQLTALGKRNGKTYLLAVDSPPTQQLMANFELSKIHRVVDYFNVMAYNFHGSWETTTNFQAPLHPSPNDPTRAQKLTISEMVQGYLRQGVPPAKLVLGAPFYGQGWAGVPRARNGLYQTSTGPAVGKYFRGLENFSELKAKLATGGFSKYYDPFAKNSWIYNPTTREFWTYDDAQSMAAKAAFVKSKQLGGMMFFNLSADTPNSELLKALAKALQ
jgi:chitinase